MKWARSIKQNKISTAGRALLALALCIGILSCATGADLIQKKKEAEAYRNVGEAYLAAGKTTLALRELLKAESLYPEDHLLQGDLGMAYMAKEHLDEAIVHFKRALEIQPDYAPAKNNLGAAYLAKGEIDQAITIFQELNQDILYASPHYPLFNLGRAYFMKKDYPAAEKYFKEALELRPEFVRARQWIGLTYMERGMMDQAIRELEKAVESAPKVGQFHYDLAKAYALDGQVSQALRHYEDAQRLAPAGSDLAEQARVAAEDLRNR
jgi:Tfp pilus assembly protein PilF